MPREFNASWLSTPLAEGFDEGEMNRFCAECTAIGEQLATEVAVYTMF